MRKATELKSFQYRMKKRPTHHERLFGERLKSAGITFKPQMILGFYILDFVLPEQMLCIEIDGANHAQRRAYDQMRDHFIEHAGFKVIRIPNDEAGTYPLDFISQLPVQPHSIFRHACSVANIEKGLAMRGLSNLPTISQKSLFA